jgi:hypothetical protein
MRFCCHMMRARSLLPAVHKALLFGCRAGYEASMNRRGLLVLLALPPLVYAGAWLAYPSDKTPKGAYFRLTNAVNLGREDQVFPYLETAAQHAAFTIHKYHADALRRILEAYPDDKRDEERKRFAELAALEPGPGVFEWYARRLGWMDQLRKDLSGVARVEVNGERATVETVRGTRYAFRQRENGMWGLTLFTARLVADAEKAARDYSLVEAAATDYVDAKGSQ